MSIFSTPWDVRALWSIMTHAAHLFLLSLFLVAVIVAVKLAKVFLALRKMPSLDEEAKKALAMVNASRIYNAQQLLGLMRLIFGIIVSNEIFACIRSVSLSRMSLSQLALSEALEAPVAMTFVVFAVFSILHVSVWAMEVTCERPSRHRSF